MNLEKGHGPALGLPASLNLVTSRDGSGVPAMSIQQLLDLLADYAAAHS